MKVITYARGSSHSFDEQQHEILKALPSEFEVAGSCVDKASGWNTERPGLNAAWKRLASSEVQALCIQSVYRLARPTDHLVVILRWCSENGFVIQEVQNH